MYLADCAMIMDNPPTMNWAACYMHAPHAINQSAFQGRLSVMNTNGKIK